MNRLKPGIYTCNKTIVLDAKYDSTYSAIQRGVANGNIKYKPHSKADCEEVKIIMQESPK